MWRRKVRFCVCLFSFLFVRPNCSLFIYFLFFRNKCWCLMYKNVNKRTIIMWYDMACNETRKLFLVRRSLRFTVVKYENHFCSCRCIFCFVFSIFLLFLKRLIEWIKSAVSVYVTMTVTVFSSSKIKPCIYIFIVFVRWTHRKNCDCLSTCLET